MEWLISSFLGGAVSPGKNCVCLKHWFCYFQVKMGLLIDLTNTTRFYDRSDIEKDGITYIKLQCKG